MSAQTVSVDPEAEEAFRAALQRFEKGQYRQAAEDFRLLAVDRPLHQKSSAAYIMAGRAFLRAGDPIPCLRLLEEFRDRFAESSYVAESHFLSADASRAAGAPGRALEYYLRAWREKFTDTELLLQRLSLLNGETFTAFDRRVAENLLAQIPDRSRIESCIPWLRAEQDAHSHRPVIIGAALPLHLKDPGRAALVDDLLHGIRAALALHTEREGYPVELRLFDSMRRDSVAAAIEYLEGNPRAVILIGGAFSEDARFVCEEAGERDLLVLLPTATADDLTRFGTNIFQLNTPIEERARLLADFSFLELDMREIVVLSPDASYPRAMADAFIAR
ncbi:MAG: amino acid ABC transporter substrate-binding protein, partial [Bacteroidetes bacterium]|nr:amino acid ABC transporter substrate-binding protein [Bacteroidota bacterium]